MIVYSDETGQTHFALPHFRTGSLTVGTAGAAALVSAAAAQLLFQVEHGAKLVCQFLEPNAARRCGSTVGM